MVKKYTHKSVMEEAAYIRVVYRCVKVVMREEKKSKVNRSVRGLMKVISFNILQHAPPDLIMILAENLREEFLYIFILLIQGKHGRT